MGAATLVYVGGALLHYRGSGREPVEGDEPLLLTPCKLGPALRFAALLVLILFLVEAGQHWLGDAGVYLVALLAELSDMDAITFSLARNAQSGLTEQVAVRSISLAALSNSLAKEILVAMIGGLATLWLL